MIHIDTEIIELRLDNHRIKLIFEDPEGYLTTYVKDGFATRQKARAAAEKKKNDILHN